MIGGDGEDTLTTNVIVPPQADAPVHGNPDRALVTVDKREELYERGDNEGTQAFFGLELVLDTHRLLLMNLMLHGTEGTGVAVGDTLRRAFQEKSAVAAPPNPKRMRYSYHRPSARRMSRAEPASLFTE